MKNIDSSVPGNVTVPQEEDFKGYSMDELRYQRALLLIRREFMREKAIKESKKITSQIPIVNGHSFLSGMTPKGVVGKLIRGLSFADYLMLGFQGVRIGKRIFSLFKRR